jgi:type III pantothenate kinase
MRSGIVFGFVGQIDEIVNRIKDELKKEHRIKKRPKVVATGGLAELIARESRTVEEVNPTLTLEGLRRIYLQTQKTQKKG